MIRSLRDVLGRLAISAAVLGVFAAVSVMLSELVWQPTTARAEEAAEAEPAPPEGQEYTGAKRCASCHFEQFMSWRKTTHANAFKDLTAKYQEDEKCLKCHTTGYGQDSGYKDGTTAALAGVTCESCHGPGSKHEEVSKPFAQTKELTPEQEKLVRDSIWLMLPKNVCIECHTVQGHKKSETPADLKKS